MRGRSEVVPKALYIYMLFDLVEVVSFFNDVTDDVSIQAQLLLVRLLVS